MTLRDAEKLKDKIEVSLDGRQIFLLFFGGAIVAALVFVLGVMVGKRIEGRERISARAGTSSAVDPLAAIDELAADEEADELAFAQALAGGSADKARPLGAADLAPPAPTVARSPDSIRSEAKPEPAKSEPAKSEPAKPEPAKPEPAKSEPAKSEPAKSEPAKPEPPKGPPKFTLQLSSFQDKAEAEAFQAKLVAAGYRPYIIKSDIPDRGTFYRVRIGHYATHEEALEAKKDFERRQHIIAYVTRL